MRSLAGLMGIGLLVVACVEPRAAEAGVLLVKGASVRQNILPPLIPLPDGSIIAPNDLVRWSWRTNFGDDDVLIVNSREGTVSRYGDRGGLSLDSLAMSFSASIMTLDPATLVLTPLARQNMSLAQLLDQPGTLVMVDVSPASVPASTLRLGADDVPTLTPTPIFTATPTPLPAPSPTATVPNEVPTFTPTPIFTAMPTSPPIPSPTATAPNMETGTPALPCHGDCNDDGEVTVDEIVRGVNIALEVLPVDACPVLDTDNDGKITIGEIIAAVNAALNGCVSG